MTGTDEFAASCSRVRCENTRAATTSTQREVAGHVGYRLPLAIPISWAARYTAAPQLDHRDLEGHARAQ